MAKRAFLNGSSTFRIFAMLMKCLFRSLLLHSILLAGVVGNVAAQDFFWARGIQGAAASTASQVATDAQGKVFVTGAYSAPVDVDPGPGAAWTANYGNSVYSYLASYTHDGLYRWHISIGSGNLIRPYGLSIDHQSNLIVSGSFNGNMDADPDSINTHMLTATGTTDGFVAKYDSTGQLLWAHKFGSISHDEVRGTTVDPAGNIYVTGIFAGSMDANPGAGTHTLFNNGVWDAYVIKLNPAGQFVWAHQVTNAASVLGTAVDYSADGSIYCTGIFQGTTDFNPTGGSANRANAGDWDAFLMRLDVSGNFHWATSVGGAGFDFADRVRADDNGHASIFGIFSDSADFDPGAGTEMRIASGTTASSPDNYFLAQYDSIGNYVWAHALQGHTAISGLTTVGDMAIDDAGSLYVTGTYFEAFDPNPAGGTDSLLLGVVQPNQFVAEYAADGTYQWSRAIHTLGTADVPNGLTADCEGNVYVCGNYSSQAVFDSLALGADTLFSGPNHAYFAKYGSICTIDTVYSNDTICWGESIQIANNTVSVAGTWSVIIEVACTCDTLLIATVEVLGQPPPPDTLYSCPGDSTFLYGAWRFGIGMFHDTLPGSSGCDSVLTTTVLQSPASVDTVTQAICTGDSIFLGGNWVDTVGVYTDSLVNSAGCDSILIVYLTMLPLPAPTYYLDFFCQGDSIVFVGQWITKAGLYVDTIAGSNGCDSIITGLLLPHFEGHDTVPVTLCTGDSMLAGGVWVNSAGIYPVQATSIHGCDSLGYVSIAMVAPSAGNDTVTLCSGDSIFLAGNWQFSAGTYVDTLVNAVGCDSVNSTLLVINSTSVLAQTVTVCEGDSALIRGQWQTQAALYSDTLQNAVGCDSIIAVQLVLNPSPTTAASTVMCVGDSVFLAGQWQFTAGVYTDSLLAASGCDSLVTTTLIVNQNSTSVQLLTICSGDSVFAAGSWQFSAGTFFDTLANTSGCDSIVTTTLTLIPPPLTAQFVTICAGDSVFFGSSWVAQSGTYTHTHTGSAGCDSIVTLQLTVLPVSLDSVSAIICENDSVLVNGNWLHNAGFYTDTLQSQLGCDSVVVTEITVLPVVYGSNTTTVICDGDSATIFGQWQTVAGTYTHTLTASNGCDSVRTHTLLLDTVPLIVVMSPEPACHTDTAIALPTAAPAGGIWSGPFIDSLNFFPAQAGVGQFELTYTVTGNIGCTRTETVSWTVTTCVGIAASPTHTPISLVPNPGNGRFEIRTAALPDRWNVSIFNSIGQRVWTVNGANLSGSYPIDLTGFASGMYFVRLQSTAEQQTLRLVLTD